jgi:hypothetical protein
MIEGSAVYSRVLQEQAPKQVTQAEEDQNYDRHDEGHQAHHVEKL